jgi:hypothetical protein
MAVIAASVTFRLLPSSPLMFLSASDFFSFYSLVYPGRSNGLLTSYDFSIVLHTTFYLLILCTEIAAVFILRKDRTGRSISSVFCTVLVTLECSLSSIHTCLPR